MFRYKKIIAAVSTAVLTGTTVLSAVQPVSAEQENHEWADEWSGDESQDEDGSGYDITSDSVQLTTKGTSNIVIVLDPGHDDSHTGARGNNLKEEELTLKIAQYCRQELEKYSGVTVYMTRESGSCPYPGTTSTQCNKRRVQYAKSVGATAYVSLHLNASNSSAPYGAEVYYPNFNYRSDVGNAGYHLAQWTLTSLLTIGLYNRGFHYRNSEDNSLYPDSSLADYYGVIKNSKLDGFPGIIVEHAFITNSGDAQRYLDSDQKLHNLGAADAAGIAAYYGLGKKEQDYSQKDLNLTVDSNSNHTQYNITAAGIPNCNSVQFAVWSLNNGQDDLKWYEGQKDSNGNWKATATISDFKTEGAYAVHAYITRSDGKKYFVGDKDFELASNSSVQKIVVSDINRQAGTFLVTVKGATADAGVANVYLPIWSQPDQSDLTWYHADKVSEGTYQVKVNIANHAQYRGIYFIHAYIEDCNAIKKNVGNTDVLLSSQNPNVSISQDSTNGYFTLHANQVPYSTSQIQLSYAVWSAENGQDDIVWYNAESLGDGSWTKNIYVPQTASKGEYFVHAYAIQYDGTPEFLADGAFEVTNDNIGAGMRGDADLDGSVTLEDANLILKAALLIKKLDGVAFTNADVDGDGSITLGDASTVLKMALGI